MFYFLYYPTSPSASTGCFYLCVWWICWLSLLRALHYPHHWALSAKSASFDPLTNLDLLGQLHEGSQIGWQRDAGWTRCASLRLHQLFTDARQVHASVVKTQSPPKDLSFLLSPPTPGHWAPPLSAVSSGSWRLPGERTKPLAFPCSAPHFHPSLHPQQSPPNPPPVPASGLPLPTPPPQAPTQEQRQPLTL